MGSKNMLLIVSICSIIRVGMISNSPVVVFVNIIPVSKWIQNYHSAIPLFVRKGNEITTFWEILENASKHLWGDKSKILFEHAKNEISDTTNQPGSNSTKI